MNGVFSLALLATVVAHGDAHGETSGHSPVSYVVLITCLVLLCGALMLLYRALDGRETVFDRILAINALGTKTVVLVACIAFLDYGHAEPSYFLDISLVYALVNFIATIAILKFIQYRRLS